MKQKSLEAAKKEKTSPEALAVLQSLRAESAESGELTLSVELGRLLSQGVEEPTSSTIDGKHMNNASVVKGLKERGITFDEELTHKAVVKEFLK